MIDRRSSPDPGAVLIAGPTASGKSSLALELAKRLGAIVINADSMQVYRELRILTARPAPDQEERVPHRLFGAVSGAEAYSAGRWLEQAGQEIKAARVSGQPAILVGGTGLYFDSLTKGLAPIPDIPAEIREKWRHLLDTRGLAVLRAALAEADPEMTARIRPSDPQRTLRALEVMEATGRSLGDWQKEVPRPILDPAETVRLVMAPPRAELHARIDARCRAMVEAGALAEVEALLAQRLDPALPVMKAIGVRELKSVLDGDITLDDGLAAIGVATRRYAKRQRTWARQRMADWRWIDPTDEDPAALAGAMLDAVRSAPAGGA